MRFTRALTLVWVALTPIVLSSAASAQVAVGVTIEVAPTGGGVGSKALADGEVDFAAVTR